MRDRCPDFNCLIRGIVTVDMCKRCYGMASRHHCKMLRLLFRRCCYGCFFSVPGTDFFGFRFQPVPMATFLVHTASPPPRGRTPTGSPAASPRASIAPRTTLIHDLPTGITNSYSSIKPGSANASGNFIPPANRPLPGGCSSCGTASL